MENVLPRFRKPLKSKADPKVEVKYWDEAVEAFDKKEFRKSAIAIINYINPSLLKDIDVEKDFEIIQMQGSAEIHLSVTQEIFSVKAPFLKITEKTNEIALLRKVAEVNFSPLTLAQIHLKGEELWFQYEMPIVLAQPNKIYDTLREVSVFADDYDDMFIEKYGAAFYKEPKKEALSDDELETVWSQISDILEDYQNYSKFFKEKRWDDYQWDIIVISLLKLSNMPYVNGKLRSDLEEYIRNMFNGNVDYHYRVDKGTEFVKKLITKSKDDWLKNIYHAERFISLRWKSSQQIMKEQAAKHLDTIQKYENDERYFNLSYFLQFTLLKFIYDFNLEADYKTAIETVLEDVSGLDPDDAAPKLMKVYREILEGDVSVSTAKEKKRGFFSKLFG